MKFFGTPSRITIMGLCLVATLSSYAVAAPKLTAITPDATVFADNWVVGTNGIASIELDFDEAVLVSADAVFAYTVDAATRDITVAPLNSATTSVTITFDTEVRANLVTIVLVDGEIRSDADASALDGEVTDPRNPVLPSGDGVAGGATVVQYAVLQGDVNRDGDVNSQDAIFMGPLFGKCVGDSGFNVLADLDGNGCIENTSSNPKGDQFILLNAPDSSLPNVADTDNDGAGDSFDNCVDDANPDQANADGDAYGDVCDNCPDLASADLTDTDNDGVGDACDNCADVSNANQANGDGDAYGDACDNCPDLASADVTDTDNDGVGDVCDNCPNVMNADQADPDNDGTGSACEICDNDPNKTDPGVCGCGATEDVADPDDDGEPNCLDNCPNVKNADQADADTDGFGDACDNCPNVASLNQSDVDTDGIGAPCDNCPTVPNPDQADRDHDGFGDACDVCPGIPNPDQDPNDCIPDADNDGVRDELDLCPGTTTNGAVDADGCTPEQRGHLDDDNDGVINAIDQCPNTAPSVTVDASGCAESQDGGNATPTPTPTATPAASDDDDGDNVSNAFDLCPDTPSGTVVDATGCPIGSDSTPAPQDTPSDQGTACGDGTACGAMGLVNIYAVLFGLGWLKRNRR